VNRFSLLAACFLLGLPPSSAEAGSWHGKRDLEEINSRLKGQVVDYTHNHGADRRIWSEALQNKRDLYIYLPPGFDPAKRYPLMIWLHGYAQDEKTFVKAVVEPLDKVVASGDLPPCIVAAPDGSIEGYACRTNPGSFFLNSSAGAFEDWVMRDVWNFVFDNFPVRPEREAHVLTGVSMGGGATFNLGIKYREKVKIVAAAFPPVNTRWVNDRGRYMASFDPEHQGIREDLRRPWQPVGRYYGIIVIRMKRLLDPIYDRRDPDAINQLARENPMEMLDLYDVQEGQLSMFIGYGGRDQFNITAQVDSFLYHAKEKGLTVDVLYLPKGKHDVETALKIFPCLVKWLAPQIAPYAPDAPVDFQALLPSPLAVSRRGRLKGAAAPVSSSTRPDG
jgi:enterochelin esterase-like enzyme